METGYGRLLFCCAQMAKQDGGDSRETREFGCLPAAMTGNNLPGFVGQDRNNKAKRFDRPSDLLDLAFAVSMSVSFTHR